MITDLGVSLRALLMTIATMNLVHHLHLLFGVLGPSTAWKIIVYRISSDCRFLLRLGLDRRFGSSTTVGVLYPDSSAGGRGPL